MAVPRGPTFVIHSSTAVRPLSLPRMAGWRDRMRELRGRRDTGSSPLGGHATPLATVWILRLTTI